jgi:hypothetical protein
MRLMGLDPDYRSEAMETPEGKGIARDRYETFMDENLRDLVEFYLDPRNPPPSHNYDDDEDIPGELLERWAEEAREESELIGFWVAWHLAGGFEHLVRSGWHRATIYRKVHRFRARYNKHPDEYVFEHIKLNHPGYWEDQIRREFEPVEPPWDELGFK